MSRLNLIEPKEAHGEAAELLSSVEKLFGATPNFMRALANSPSTLAGFLELHSNLGRGALDLKTRERLALAMAEANACRYCVSAHSALGARAGLDDDEILAARRGGSADARADAIVKFARTVLENTGDVTSAELASVREAGASDAEIVEIIANVALQVWTNILGKAGQIDIDFPEVNLLGQEPSGSGDCCAA